MEARQGKDGGKGNARMEVRQGEDGGKGKNLGQGRGWGQGEDGGKKVDVCIMLDAVYGIHGQIMQIIDRRTDEYGQM